MLWRKTLFLICLALDVWTGCNYPELTRYIAECFWFGGLQSPRSCIPHGSVPPGVVNFLFFFFWNHSKITLCSYVFCQLVVSDSVTQWTVACQAPLSMRFSRQEVWNGLPFTSPGDLPGPGNLLHPCMGKWILYCCTTWEAYIYSFILPQQPCLTH